MSSLYEVTIICHYKIRNNLYHINVIFKFKASNDLDSSCGSACMYNGSVSIGCKCIHISMFQMYVIVFFGVKLDKGAPSPGFRLGHRHFWHFNYCLILTHPRFHGNICSSSLSHLYLGYNFDMRDFDACCATEAIGYNTC